MTQPWDPTHVVNEREAVQLIESQFPQLKPVTIKTIGAGFDNTVYRINKNYLFRFPRREMAVDLLLVENQLLPELVDLLPLAIPSPVFYGTPSEQYPFPFTGFQYVEGQMPTSIPMQTSDENLKRFACFLKTIHSFSVKKAEKLGVPYDKYGRLNIEKRKPVMQGFVQKLYDKGLWVDDSLSNYVDRLTPIPLQNTEVLCHGDLHVRNIIVDKEGELSGIIDWGDTHLGNPAVDLCLAFSYFTPKDREKIFHYYGDVSDQMRELARFKSVYVSMILCLYGYDSGDEALIKITKQGIEYSLVP